MPRVQGCTVVDAKRLTREPADTFFVTQDRKAIWVHGKNSRIEEIEGDLRKLVFTILERKQGFAPSLFDFFVRKRRMQKCFEKQVECVIDARRGQERTRQAKTIAARKTAQTSCY